MNLTQARIMTDYLNEIKTMQHKRVTVGIIRNQEDIQKHGHFCVRIFDPYTEEIAEYYDLSHRAYKAMREEVKTDFTRYYHVKGHLFYDLTGLN